MSEIAGTFNFVALMIPVIALLAIAFGTRNRLLLLVAGIASMVYGFSVLATDYWWLSIIFVLAGLSGIGYGLVARGR